MDKVRTEWLMIFKDKLRFYHFFATFLLLCSFFLPYIAGSFSSSAKIENLSNYIAESVTKNTISGSIMGITVGSTDDSGPILSEQSEFYDLYGIFRQQNATFASGYNIHKDNYVKIDKLGHNNYSIFHSAKDATVPYNGHYKHWYYPVEFMFPARRLYDISHYMIYLSQSQANVLLSESIHKETNDYDVNDYESLIKTTIDVNVNGQKVMCVIGNIFYETNYYYGALKETMNDFIMCAYYCPGGLQRENIYFFNEKAYQNSYFINHIQKGYSNKLYELKVVNNNLKNPVNESYVLSFYYSDIRDISVVTIPLIILSIFLIASVSLLNISTRSFKNIKYIILNLFSFFGPYIIFFIISKLSNSVLFFSNYAITIFIYLLLFYFACNVILFVLHKFITRKRYRRGPLK